MALQIKRGTNASRLTQVLQEGEPFYVTDAEQLGVTPLWVGDGATYGGIASMTANNLHELLDVNVSSPANNQLMQFNSGTGTWKNVTNITIPGTLTSTGVATMSSGLNVTGQTQTNTLTTTGNATIGGNATITGNTTITGNLTISGTTTTVNSETVNIADNIIVLNSDYTGSTPTENGGIEIERGTLPNVSIRWNEADGTWELTHNGSTYNRLPNQNVSYGSSPTFGDVLAGSVSAGLLYGGTLAVGALDSATQTKMKLQNAHGYFEINNNPVNDLVSFYYSNCGGNRLQFDQYNQWFPTGDVNINNGHLRVSGDITANGGDLITNSTGTATLFNTNATSLNIGGAAEAVSIGASTGTTTINNQFGTKNYVFPVADGNANQVLKTNGAGSLTWYTPADANTTYTINASSGSNGANFNLVGSDSVTDTIKFANGSGITVSRTDESTITINSDITQYTNAMARASLSAGTGISYNSTTGVISSGITQYTDASARSALSAGTGISYNSSTGAISSTITQYTDSLARAALSGGTGVYYNSTTGNFAIGQDVTPTMDVTFAKTSAKNFVKGAIRTFSTGSVDADGDIFKVISSDANRGISIDNSEAGSTTKRSTVVLRNYGSALTSGTPRNIIIGENAKGTAASPAYMTTGLSLLDVQGTGYTSSGWLTDQIGAPAGILRLYTTEDWSNGLNKVGTGFRVLLQPAATTVTASTPQTSLQISPEASIVRTDTLTFQNKSATTTIASMDLANRTFNITGPNSEILLKTGNVNIMEAGSTWQSAFAPGFKYTGLMSSSTQTSSGSYFEMSSRWKSSSGASTYSPPQNNWGLGKFGFTADNSTTNTSQLNAGYIQAYATENWDSTHTGSKLVFSANKAGVAGVGIDVLGMSPEQTTFNSDTISLSNSSNSVYLTLNSSNATFTKPVGFPVKTAAQWNAITGSIGQQVCVSDSPSVGGRMAFWDATNSRWAYISDNSAV